jgi:polyadenylate-binding protein
MLLNDKPVFVGYHVPRKVRDQEAAAVRAQFTNLYIKNLPEDMEQEEFEKMFTDFGDVLSAIIQFDEESKSKGFGFVNYENHECARLAVDALHEKEIRGKVLYVQRAQKKSEREDELRRQYESARQERLQKYQGNNVYIKNLDDEVDDENLRNEFTNYGTITSAKVMRDEKNNSRGFGFVCFSSPDEATKAVTEMNGKMLGSKPLYVALAQRKDQRRAQLEAQHAQRSHMPQPYRMGGPGGPNSMMPPGSMYPGQPMYFSAGHHRGYYASGPQGAQHVRPRWGHQPGAPGVLPPGAMPYAMSQYPGNGMGGPMPGAPVIPQGGQGNGGPQQPNGPQNVRSGGRGRGGHQMRGAGQHRMPRGQHANSHGFKYTANARNMQPGQHQQQNPMGMQQQQMNDGKHGGEGNDENGSSADAPALPPTLTLAALAAADSEQQKQLLGEALFPLILSKEPVFAPKITGMLLEMDATEVLHLLESPEDLAAKVSEAADLVRKHLEESEA